MIPTYILSGFLESGKTTLMNRLIKPILRSGARLLTVQFERGPVALAPDLSESAAGRLTALYVPKREWDADPAGVVRGIRRRIREAARAGRPYAQLWIEWNGMSPFSELYAAFLRPEQPGLRNSETLRDLCRIESVIHLTDGDRYRALSRQSGSPLPEQLAHADVVVVRGGDFRAVKRDIQQMVPGLGVIPAGSMGRLQREMRTKPFHPAMTAAFGLLIFAVLWMIVRPMLNLRAVPVDQWVGVFLGILLQAMPFLLLGVLISSAIQVLLPAGWFEAHFPKHRVGSLFFALVAGFFLPVCDCASIPVFHSLVRKGVPLPSAVTFMVASPIINPVVILSTWYAYGGDVRMVWSRFGLGVLLGLLTGLTFCVGRARPVVSDLRADRLLCRCGIFDGSGGRQAGGRLGLYLQHVRIEFLDIVRYLIVAAAVSAVMQTSVGIAGWFSEPGHWMVSVLLMMAAAFLLSLCSSSDAVIGRSLAVGFPVSAMLAFLVFGPVMDLKNIIMLSGSCRKRFILRLFLTTAALCLLLVLAYHFLLSGRLFPDGLLLTGGGY